MTNTIMFSERGVYPSPEESYYSTFLNKPSYHIGQPPSLLSSPSDTLSLPMQPFTVSRPGYLQSFNTRDLSSCSYRDISQQLDGGADSYHNCQNSQVVVASARESPTPKEEEPKFYNPNNRRPRTEDQFRARRKESSSLPESPTLGYTKSSPSSDHGSAPGRRSISEACKKHNEIEKKYRANLNGQLEALRQVVISLPRGDLIENGLDQRSTKATVIAGARSALLQLQAEKTEVTRKLEELRVQNLAYRELLSGSSSKSGY